VSWRELNCRELLLNWKLALKLASSGTHYITAAPTTQKTSPPPLFKRVYQLLNSNGRGVDNSESTIASLPSNDKQTLVLLLLRAFRGFYGSNSYRMGEARHTAPSLRLFCPEQPNGVSPFLPSLGCDCNVILLWSLSSFFLWFSFFRGCHSPTATSALSLRPARLERFPDNLQSVRFTIFIQGCLTHSISHTVGAITYGVVGAPTCPAVTPCAASFSASEVADPSTLSKS
jgi:hypothetical protein